MALFRTINSLEPLPPVDGDGVVLRTPQMADFAAWAVLREASRKFLTPWEPTWPADDLGRAWEVLAEAVQTVMRVHGIPDAYDKLKDFTRGRPIDAGSMREFIASLSSPAEENMRLLELRPDAYLGLAPLLAYRSKPDQAF